MLMAPAVELQVQTVDYCGCMAVAHAEGVVLLQVVETRNLG
jgi:hypothetical protein